MTTKQIITTTAEAMITEHGLINLSRKELCNRAGISDGSFSYIMDCSFTEFISKLKDNSNKIHAVVKSRVDPLLRKDHILNVAVELSQRPGGFNNLERKEIAEAANVSQGLINNYYGTMKQLKRAVIRVAIQREIPVIIAQGLAVADKQAQKAPKNLKNQAAHLIANL